MFPAKHCIWNSLQHLLKYMHKGAYESGCASVSAQPRTQSRVVLGAVLQSWLLENLLRRFIVICCCTFSSWTQGALLSVCCFGRSCPPTVAIPSCTQLCTSPVSCPQKKGLLMFVWQPNTFSYTVYFAKEGCHPSAPCEDPSSMQTWLVASQPCPRTHHFRPQESSSAQPPDYLTGVYLNCMPWFDVTEGSDFQAVLNIQSSWKSQQELWP